MKLIIRHVRPNPLITIRINSAMLYITYSTEYMLRGHNRLRPIHLKEDVVALLEEALLSVQAVSDS